MNIQRPRYLKIASGSNTDRRGNLDFRIYKGDPLTGYKFANAPKHCYLQKEYTWEQIEDMKKMTKKYTVLLMSEGEYFLECL